MRGQPDGVPHVRPDGPDPGEPLRDRAGRRLHPTCGRRPTARASCAAGCSRTRSTCPPSRARRRLRADAAPALARRELQPVLGHPQPVAVRRAGHGLDRDHAGGPRARRLVLRTRGRRHLRGLGRRRRAATSSTRTGPRSPGYSMGGYGTYKFATQYPGPVRPGATHVVGPPGLGVWAPPGPPQPGGAASNTNRMLASVRNIPFLIWDGAAGRAGPGGGPGRPGADLRRSRLPLRRSTCSRPADHFTLAINDQYAPAAAFLGTRRCDRNPPHVSYVSTRRWTSQAPEPSPTMPTGCPAFASAIRPAARRWAAWTPARRDSAAPTRPRSRPARVPSNLLQGGNLPPLNYSERRKTWGPERTVPKQERAAPRRPQPRPRGRAPSAARI